MRKSIKSLVAALAFAITVGTITPCTATTAETKVVEAETPTKKAASKWSWNYGANKSNKALAPKQSFKFEAVYNGKPVDPSVYNVTYKTSNKNVVYITKSGVATADKFGKLKKNSVCKVTATVTNKQTKKKVKVLTANVYVVLSGAVGVELRTPYNVEKMSLQPGATWDFDSLLTDEDGTRMFDGDPSLYCGWFTSDATVATVDLISGVVTGVAAGQAEITVATFKSAADRKVGLSRAIAKSHIWVTVDSEYVVRFSSAEDGDTIYVNNVESLGITLYDRDCHPISTGREWWEMFYTSDETIAKFVNYNDLIGVTPGEVVVSVAIFKNQADYEAGLSKAVAIGSITVNVESVKSYAEENPVGDRFYEVAAAIDKAWADKYKRELTTEALPIWSVFLDNNGDIVSYGLSLHNYLIDSIDIGDYALLLKSLDFMQIEYEGKKYNKSIFRYISDTDSIWRIVDATHEELVLVQLVQHHKGICPYQIYGLYDWYDDVEDQHFDDFDDYVSTSELIDKYACFASENSRYQPGSFSRIYPYTYEAYEEDRKFWQENYSGWTYADYRDIVELAEVLSYDCYLGVDLSLCETMAFYKEFAGKMTINEFQEYYEAQPWSMQTSIEGFRDGALNRVWCVGVLAKCPEYDLVLKSYEDDYDYYYSENTFWRENVSVEQYKKIYDLTAELDEDGKLVNEEDYIKMWKYVREAMEKTGITIDELLDSYWTATVRSGKTYAERYGVCRGLGFYAGDLVDDAQ